MWRKKGPSLPIDIARKRSNLPNSDQQVIFPKSKSTPRTCISFKEMESYKKRNGTMHMHTPSIHPSIHPPITITAYPPSIYKAKKASTAPATMPTPLLLPFSEKAAPSNSAGGAPIAPVPVGSGTDVKPEGTG